MAKMTSAATTDLNDEDDQKLDTRFGTPLDAIYVGVGGDLKLTLSGDTAGVIFKNTISGTMYELSAKVIWSTGTSATDIIRLDTGSQYA